MDPLTIWILAAATLWLIRILFEELWAALQGRVSPRVERRRAREALARECGVPTVGQALSFRLARRIAHPPERRLLGRLRALLVECAEDALAEARVRHQRNQQQRAWRRAQAAGWRVRTGGPTSSRTGGGPSGAAGGRTAPPPPGPPGEDDDVIDTRPCRRCRSVLVVAPDELCEACEHAETTPPPDPDPDPGPDADPAPGPTHDDRHDDMYDERKEPPMSGAAATHQINGDVRDPRTALAFADASRGFNEGIRGQLDILAANLERVGVGTGPIADVRVLSDHAGTYSTSAGKSIKRYAQHVIAQADIAGDDDVKNTVARTYLDTRGADGPAAPQGEARATVKATINAADCDTPAAGAKLMDAVADAYAALQTSVEQVTNAHTQQGVTGEPIVFLREQLDLATGIAGKARKAADRFRTHIRRRDDTVGKDPSLHGTQKDKYLDPTRA